MTALAGVALGLVVLLPILLHLRVLRPDSILDLHVAPARFLDGIAQGWTPREDLGRRTSSLIAYLPIAVTFVILRGIGLSAVAVEQAWFAIILGGSAFGMRRLFGVLWQDQRVAPRTLAALLYTFNPFVLLNLGSATVLLLTYTILPWLAAELVLASRTRRLRHVVAAVLLASLGSPGVNATQNVIMWLGCLALVVAAARHEQIKGGVRYAAAVVGIATIASMWWIGPFLASLRGGGVDVVFQTDPIEIGASNSSFGEVIRLTGLWALYFGNNGVPYVRAHDYLLAAPVVAISLLLPLLALVGAWTRWGDGRVRALLAVFVVAVPMAVSVYPPTSPSLTGTGYRWLYENVFAFRGFRSNYKWAALLALVYALLAPLAWRAAATSSARRLAVASVTAAVVLVHAVPFVADLTFARGYELGSIPPYWKEAGRWLDAQRGEGRVLFTPGQPFAAYDWGRPSGDITPLLLDRPVVSSKLVSQSNPEGRELVKLTDQAVRDPTVPFDKLLAVLGVSYVVQRNDLDVELYDSIPDAEMRVFLGSQPSLRLVRTFGKLDVYEVQGPPPTPVATAEAMDLIIVDGSLSDGLRHYQPGTLARFERARQVNEAIVGAEASSVWSGLEEEYGPMRVFDGDPSTAWVTNRFGGVGEFLTATFRESLPLSRVEVEIRRNGIDAEPTVLRLEVDTGSQTVTVNPDGRAVATFDGAATRTLRVVLVETAGGAGRSGNVGLTEVRVAGVPPSVVSFSRAEEEERPKYTIVGPSRSSQLQALHYRRVSSSEVQTSAVPLDAKYLFFSETADPFWRATLDGRPLQWIGKANGYGNVWALDEGGGRARLTFGEQGTIAFWGGLSLVGGVIGLIGLAVVGRYRHRSS